MRRRRSKLWNCAIPLREDGRARCRRTCCARSLAERLARGRFAGRRRLAAARRGDKQAAAGPAGHGERRARVDWCFMDVSSSYWIVRPPVAGGDDVDCVSSCEARTRMRAGLAPIVRSSPTRRLAYRVLPQAVRRGVRRRTGGSAVGPGGATSRAGAAGDPRDGAGARSRHRVARSWSRISGPKRMRERGRPLLSDSVYRINQAVRW